MATVWRTTDRLGREVVLTEAAWAHIIGEPKEMAGREADVLAAVRAPGRVTRDAGYRRRENHYRRTPSGRRWLKVVVRYRPVAPQGT